MLFNDEEKKTPEDIANEANTKREAEKEETRLAGLSEEERKAETDKKEADEKTAQEESDKKLSETEDSELDEEQLARKKTLLDAEPQEEEHLNKEDSEVEARLKTLEEAREADKAKIAELERANAELAAKTTPAEEPEANKLARYLREDAGKPREQRREMPKEELEEWLIEDTVSAQEWLAERTHRRATERDTIARSKKESEDKTSRAKATKEFMDKQDESLKAVEKNHPELNSETIQKREAVLKAKGLKPEEVLKKMCEENEKYGMAVDIIKNDPHKYHLKPNGPELVAEEMEKRLARKKDKETTKEREERIKAEAAEEERQRQEKIDPSLRNTDASKDEDKRSEFEKERDRVAAKAGISKDRLKKRLDTRSKIPGAGR